MAFPEDTVKSYLTHVIITVTKWSSLNVEVVVVAELVLLVLGSLSRDPVAVFFFAIKRVPQKMPL